MPSSPTISMKRRRTGDRNEQITDASAPRENRSARWEVAPFVPAWGRIERRGGVHHLVLQDEAERVDTVHGDVEHGAATRAPAVVQHERWLRRAS